MKGIIKYRKFDHTETLRKGYYWADDYDNERVEGYGLFEMPYYSEFDFSKNSYREIMLRNTFDDYLEFDNTTNKYFNDCYERI